MYFSNSISSRTRQQRQSRIHSRNRKIETLKMRIVSIVLLILGLFFFWWTNTSNHESDKSLNEICPGSPVPVHAKCEMSIRFNNAECRIVMEEIRLRLQHTNGWTDPHNNGGYSLISSTSNFFEASRQTGNGLYTDLFNLEFSNLANDGSCLVRACSESQVTSVLDFSTNYCNIHNLYNGKNNIVRYDINDFQEEYTDCGQRNKQKCTTD